MNREADESVSKYNEMWCKDVVQLPHCRIRKRGTEREISRPGVARMPCGTAYVIFKWNRSSMFVSRCSGGHPVYVRERQTN